MAEPLSIAVVLGLAFIAKKLSEQTPETYVAPSAPEQQKTSPMYNPALVPQSAIYQGPIKKKETYEVQPSFGDVAPNVTFANGMPSPTQDFLDRMWISNQQNNLSPTDKIMVGPGLGVGPDVPAVGGYQQLYRTLPNNVGAYRLTQLPGRAGPRDGTALAGGISPSWGYNGKAWGEVAHNRPEKTAFLPDRLPVQKSRAQGQGGENTGVTVRESYERTMRATNRAETTLRTDGLSYAPAKRFVPAGEVNQDPTRNKTDFNEAQFFHVDNPAPGITNFVGAYTSTGNNIRDDDKRSNPSRPGPAGGMNVMLGTPGKVTVVRAPLKPEPIMARGPTASSGQQYVPLGYQEDNQYKGNMNPYASNSSLNIAVKQLDKNPLAHSISR
jgi:hypothetical protein